MSEKDKKEYNIEVHGTTTVKAYTRDEARVNVEKSKQINCYKGVKTHSIWDLVYQGLLMNLGGFMSTLVAIIMIICWSNFHKNIISTLPDDFKPLGLMVWFILIMTTLRIPKIIGGWYDFDKHNR